MGSEDHAPSQGKHLSEVHRFRACLDAAPDLLIVANATSGHICNVNQTACRWLGHDRESLLGSSVGQWLEGNDTQFSAIQEELSHDQDGIATLVTHLKGRGNRAIPVELATSQVLFNEEQLIVVIGRDITDRKRSEEAFERRIVALTQPLETNRSVAFEELFDLESIQRIQDLFAEATGVASIITRPDGTPITKPSNFCRLCNDIIRKTPVGCANCYRSDAVIGRQNPDGPVVQTCLSGGLWDAGASVTVGGRHIANWLIGQVRNEAQDEAAAIRYAEKIGADTEAYREAFREVPTMSREKFECVAVTI